MGELRVMGKEGDTKTIWSPDNAEEVTAARNTFEKLTGKGYRAYRVDKEGEKASRMIGFDAEAGKVILVPPVVGG